MTFSVKKKKKKKKKKYRKTKVNPIWGRENYKRLDSIEVLR